MEKRIYFLIGIFFLLFASLILRVITIISTSDADFYDYTKSRFYRKDIYDRNGNLLATNVPTASIAINPKKVVNISDTVDKIVRIFPDLDKSSVIKKLQQSKSFVWIKRDVLPKHHQMIHNLGIPGLIFEKEEKRVYIYGNLLSHVIGYTGRDLVGLAGIEKYFDKILQDENNDNSLKLSIDIKLQNILHEELERTIKKFSAKRACGIIVDPNNGQILALSSKPDFNPHQLKKRDNQYFNIASSGVYEIGSGMKSITLAVGLDSKSTTMSDVYDLSSMKVGKFQVKDTYPMQGWRSVPQIFFKSSNIGVAQIALEFGKKTWMDYLKKLGLLDRVNVELPERSKSIYYKLDAIKDINLVTMSYGYGISISPLHFVQAMIPIMNGGVFYPLTLLNKKQEGKRVLNQETSNSMKQLLRLVVSKGTASKAEIKGYYIGGKTGTAFFASKGGYDKTKRRSSFLGMLPSIDPRYLIYVMFEEPKGIKETYGFAGGGWVAAPCAGEIFRKIISLYGILPLDPNELEVQELTDIEYELPN